jgi:hypothetical protein
VLAALIALGVLVQAAAIAFGWFDAIHDVDNGLVIDENYDGNAGHILHGIVGLYAIPLLGLVLLIVSFFAAKEVPGARKWAGIVLDHCHNLDHARDGLIAHLAYTGVSEPYRVGGSSANAPE